MLSDDEISVVETLPRDIWDLVVWPLLPEPPATWTLLPHGTWPDFIEKHQQWEEWKCSRSDLVALRQTSRRLSITIEPYLLQSAVIVGGRGLVSLCTLLDAKPYLGESIRGLYCLADLQSDEVVEAVGIRAGQVSPQPLRSMDQALPVSGARTSQRRPSDYLDDILSRAPKVSSLLCSFPQRWTYLRSILPRIHAKNAQGELMVPPCPFDQLRTLRIRRDMTMENKRSSWREGAFICDILWYLPHLPQLETFEMAGDLGGTWRNGVDYQPRSNPEFPTLVPVPPYAKMQSLKHIRLYASCILEPEVVSLCLACPNLQTLLVHFEEESEQKHRSWLLEGKSLNDALAELSESLRHLELLIPDGGHYMTAKKGDSAPRAASLTILERLTALEYLKVDFRGLFGRTKWLDQQSVEEVLEGLPPSLRALNVVTTWGGRFEIGFQVDMDDTAIFIHGLTQCHRLGKLPKQLNMLSLALSHVGAAEYDPRAGALDEARSYFLDTPVNFQIEAYPGRIFATVGYVSGDELYRPWQAAREEEDERRQDLIYDQGRKAPFYALDT